MITYNVTPIGGAVFSFQTPYSLRAGDPFRRQSNKYRVVEVAEVAPSYVAITAVEV